MSAQGLRNPPTHVGLILALYTLEAAGFVLVIAINKYVDRLGVLSVRQVTWIVAPATALVASGAYSCRCYLRSRPSGARQFNLTLAMNALSIVILLATGEMVVRLFSVPTPQGLSFAHTLLLPRSWEHVRTRNAQLLRTAPSDVSHLVADSLLGWTLGRSRRSADGLYLSSAEGIRSPRAGMVYAEARARQRVATVGNSYTFGLDVPFEESWGFRLERALGPEFAVLNFGVEGYGVDQAYLRYSRDVRPWRPAVTIFGFIDHDLYRSLSVYNFVTFPEWNFPFSKPRFILKAGKLELLNVPLASLCDVFARKSITALPFIEYDPGYNAAEWQWHLYYSSRLLRFLLSRFPRWPLENTKAGTETLLRINSELLLTFVRRAAAEGTVPLVVYFPSKGDFSGQDRSGKDTVLAVLQQSGVPYLNLTSCIREVGPEKAFLRERPHYSAEGNAAVARCLVPAVRRALQRERGRFDVGPVTRARRDP